MMSASSMDTQLLADGCTALLQLVFGDANWYRWTNVREQSPHGGVGDLQAFIGWMLDVTEREIIATQHLPHSQPKQYREYRRMQGVYHTDRGADNDKDNVASVYEESDISTYRQSTSEENVMMRVDDYYGVSVGVAGVVPPEVDVKLEGTSCLEVGGGEVVEYEGEDAGSRSRVEIVFAGNMFQCSECQVSLSDVEVVREHMNLRHPSHAAAVACRCGCLRPTFPTLRSFVDYHRAAAGRRHDRRNPHVCPRCAKAFPSRQRLTDHVANKHDKTGPRYQCPVCAKRFSHRTTYCAHKRKCEAALKEPGAADDLHVPENYRL